MEESLAAMEASSSSFNFDNSALGTASYHP